MSGLSSSRARTSASSTILKPFSLLDIKPLRINVRRMELRAGLDILSSKSISQGVSDISRARTKISIKQCVRCIPHAIKRRGIIGFSLNHLPFLGGALSRPLPDFLPGFLLGLPPLPLPFPIFSPKYLVKGKPYKNVYFFLTYFARDK